MLPRESSRIARSLSAAALDETRPYRLKLGTRPLLLSSGGAIQRGRTRGPRKAGCAIGSSNLEVVPNINHPEFDEPREHEGFSARRARLGHQLGSERVGASLWELPAGQAAYPYHYHLAEEEMVIVLTGAPTLRTPDGWRELEEGEVVDFPRGEHGAHQLVNRSEETVRFVAVSTHGDPDVVLYPDSNKIGASERLPRGGGLRTFFRLEDQVEYWDGELPPAS